MVDFKKIMERNRMATKKNSKAIELGTKSDALTTTTSKDAAALAVRKLEDLFEQQAGAGMETMDAKDLAIPRISLLQSGSPQVKKSEGAYIKGAEEGDFYENVTNSILAKGEQGLIIIPVSYRRAHIEWVPKEKGGGFVQDHGADSSILAKTHKGEKGGDLLANGNQIVTTAEYYVYVLDSKGQNPRQAVISLASTQLKKAKKLNSLLSSISLERKNGQGRYTPPMFYSAFDLVSVPESNDKGSWMGWSFSRRCNTAELPNGAQIALDAAQFHKAVSSGAVRVADPVEGGTVVDAGDDNSL